MARRQQFRHTRLGNDLQGASRENPGVQNARWDYFTIATCRIAAPVHAQRGSACRPLSACTRTS